MSRHASVRATAAMGRRRKARTNRRGSTIMTTDARTRALPQGRALYAATPVTAMAEANSLRRCERALDMLLTQRGDPFAEVERVLTDDPGCVFGHCLRAALIVRAESLGSRSVLAAS